jgi:hypothetical protein
MQKIEIEQHQADLALYTKMEPDDFYQSSVRFARTFGTKRQVEKVKEEVAILKMIDKIK